MSNIFEPPFFSLFTLSILIITSLFWLVLRTLQEGRKALKEISKDKS